jgi:hypothetical protein
VGTEGKEREDALGAARYVNGPAVALHREGTEQLEAEGTVAAGLSFGPVHGPTKGCHGLSLGIDPPAAPLTSGTKRDSTVRQPSSNR